VAYIPEEDLTKEQVEKWLKLACVRELNVFYDHNKIITLLCRELLKKWDSKPKKP
jgi:hypothetical protein